jgi:hypothetical protein
MERQMTAWDEVGLVVLDVVGRDADQETQGWHREGCGCHGPRKNPVTERCASIGQRVTEPALFIQVIASPFGRVLTNGHRIRP